MKAKLGLLVVMFLLLHPISTTAIDDVCMADSAVLYYRIINNETWLYASQDMEQKYFLLPNTYFVRVIDMVTEDIAKVEFDDIKGFVNTNNMQACYSAPNVPYPTSQQLNILSVCNVVVYSEPTDTSQYIGLVPFNATNIKYYGSTENQEAISGLGCKWHYIKYCSFEQGVLCGYVYAPLTTNLCLAPANEEVVNTQAQQTTETNALPASAEFGDADSLFIIVGLGVLALVLLYLLFKTDKRKKAKHSRALSAVQKDKLPYMAKHNENDEFDF